MKPDSSSGAAMTITIDDLREDLVVDFARTRKDLIEARLRHQEKDTPDNRSTVAECKARIDRVLDMYIDVVHGAPEDRRPQAHVQIDQSGH
jgi:hypothetical protein